MDDNLITIASYPYTRALMLQNRLEMEGIECSLENMNRIRPTVPEDVRVKVQQSDLQQALKIIEEIQDQYDQVNLKRDEIHNFKITKILVPIDFTEFSKSITASEPINGGNFIPSGSQSTPPNGGSDILSPALNGIYRVIIDFKTGTYSVAKAPGLIATPASLYMVGDATALGWAAPNATQKFTQTDANTFTITLPLIGGKKYDFITTATTWSDPAYKGATNAEPPTGGNFIASGAATVPAWGGSDIIAPAASGTYKITVNFKSGTYVLTQ